MRTTFHAAILMTLLVSNACRRNERSTPSSRDEGPAVPAKPTNVAEKPEAAAKAKLDSSLVTLAKATDADSRLSAFRVVAALVHADPTSAHVNTVKTAMFDPASTAVLALDALDKADADAEAALPVVTTKPEYDPPKYSGPFFLGGVYRGPFNSGGVVVESGGKYYVIEDAEKPMIATYLSGYVEDTGKEVTLNIGKDGRDATVVKLSDKESYADEKKSHAKAVSDYQTTFNADLAAHNKAKTERAKADAAFASSHAKFLVERPKLSVKADAAIQAYAAEHGGPPAAAADAAKPPPATMATTAASAPTAAAVPVVAPAKKKSVMMDD